MFDELADKPGSIGFVKFAADVAAVNSVADSDFDLLGTDSVLGSWP